MTRLPVEDHYSWSHDNVRLHWRNWPGPADAASRPALLCIPGLTRNMRDFEALARHFSRRFRLVTLSLRGRGESGYAADKLSYVPLAYLQDLDAVIADAGLERFAVIGTSLGGLLGMMLPMTQAGRLAGLVLNDVGPDLEEEGLARVRQQVLRRGDGWPSWLLAARDLAARQGAIHPRFTLGDWLAHAKRLCRVSPEGRIIFDYDPEIAAPFALPNNDRAVDLWKLLESWAGKPVLNLRGATSDIFSAAAQQAMAARLPQLTAITVPDVGHAPTLAEPAAAAALEAFTQGLA